MKPFRTNITIYQGATFRWSAVWKAGPYQLPVDLTDCTGAMQVRREAAATTVLATATVTLGGIAGTIEAVISATDTAAVTGTDAVFDLEITLANQEVVKLAYGDVLIVPEVTRV